MILTSALICLISACNVLGPTYTMPDVSVAATIPEESPIFCRDTKSTMKTKSERSELEWKLIYVSSIRFLSRTRYVKNWLVLISHFSFMSIFLCQIWDVWDPILIKQQDHLFQWQEEASLCHSNAWIKEINVFQQLGQYIANHIII